MKGVKGQTELLVRERCVKSFLDVIVASVLAERPSWGYDIIAQIHGKLHVLLSPGTVYPVLHSMEARGLVSRRREGRRETFYLTERGANWFAEVLEASRREHADFLQNYLQRILDKI
ncbi:PadR family transcriptional regulator [Candidatus Hecatella orcuttiae]|uniref:PadR family transcriptional regulator n=1 Tax=Candidatus Hecatella orcuttiae TaxID=1935119 RepID=UPI002867F3AA|nr:PadR family transcriptional regulator [Candidatus Hecatella orcuttiae]